MMSTPSKNDIKKSFDDSTELSTDIDDLSVQLVPQMTPKLMVKDIQTINEQLFRSAPKLTSAVSGQEVKQVGATFTPRRAYSSIEVGNRFLPSIKRPLVQNSNIELCSSFEDYSFVLEDDNQNSEDNLFGQF